MPEHVHPEELGPGPCRLIPAGSETLADTSAVPAVPRSYTSTATRSAAPRLSGPLTTTLRLSLADPAGALDWIVLGDGVDDAAGERVGDGAGDTEEDSCGRGARDPASELRRLEAARLAGTAVPITRGSGSDSCCGLPVAGGMARGRTGDDERCR